MIYCGVDPSTKTGVVLFRPSGGISSWVLTSKLKGIRRVFDLKSQLDVILDQYQPTAMCIEGYAFANRFTLALLVEINSAMRLSAHTRSIPCYIAPPSVVKLFATGKGNADKKAIALSVKERWGFEAPSDDVLDAYVMAQIAKKCVETGPFKGIELL